MCEHKHREKAIPRAYFAIRSIRQTEKISIEKTPSTMRQGLAFENKAMRESVIDSNQNPAGLLAQYIFSTFKSRPYEIGDYLKTIPATTKQKPPGEEKGGRGGQL